MEPMEEGGEWWLPDTPDIKVSGVLRKDRQGGVERGRFQRQLFRSCPDGRRRNGRTLGDHPGRLDGNDAPIVRFIVPGTGANVDHPFCASQRAMDPSRDPAVCTPG